MAAEAVHIGKAAKLAGASVDTIRSYEQRELIKSTARSAGGIACSMEGGFAISHLCEQAQELGFSERS
jgi:DNA-binding transcriptional MerR regulator